MSTVVVLAMHGAPPNDFPRDKLGEFFGLHSKVESGRPALSGDSLARYRELEQKIRDWPRDKGNDPFYAGSMSLALEIERSLGIAVVVGFNEFCSPDLAGAFEQAVGRRPDQVVVLTPMLTRGGSHSEGDIPRAVAAASRTYPSVSFRYAWPIAEREVAGFLARQVSRILAEPPEHAPIPA